MKKIFDRIVEILQEMFGPNVFTFRAETVSDIDLGVELDKRAGGLGLNWRESVVDFLKLLEIDSSRKNREALAEELGVDSLLKSGTAEGNEALRKALFRRLAENGGQVPASLLD